MIAPIDPATLSPNAQRVALPTAPQKMQEVAARGVMPGLKPGEIVAVLVVLSRSERPSVKETAQKTLAALPDQLLQGALSNELAPEAIDVLARANAGRIDVLDKLLAMPALAIDTVEELAKTGSEAVTELVATNEARLLENPRLIELLYMNKSTRMSTADRIVELAVRNEIDVTGIPAWKEAATAIQNELVAEPSEEPTPDDVLFQETDALAQELVSAAEEDTHVEDDEGKEVLKDKFKPLYQRIAEMTVSQKIRRAMLGSKEERMLLIRDNNKIVASAAVRSPLMVESEAALVSRNRNVADEVLRVIGSTPEWLKSYVVKRNLVENPKTPVMISTRLVNQLREADLRSIAKSKNVTGPVQDAARRQLERRKT